MYDTPYLTLHDWEWTEHRIQHSDDGFWTRYLALYLENQASLKHYQKASAQLSNLCHTLRRKLAPPDVKLLVYTLSVKAQIRYPAGLAPWTLQQYQLLDRKHTSLLRQVYGLRRTFPTTLIYTPTSLGGCGEELICDTFQLQKWTYLQLVSHLGVTSLAVVTVLICRAQQNTISSPSRYCSSLLDWSQQIGLSLTRAPSAELP